MASCAFILNIKFKIENFQTVELFPLLNFSHQPSALQTILPLSLEMTGGREYNT